jgi:hypothetical protein
MRLSVGIRIAAAIAALSCVSVHAQLVFRSASGREIGSVIPLGIAPPPGTTDNTAAFWIQTQMPPGVLDVPGGLRLDVVAELVPDSDAPRTPPGYPASRRGGACSRSAAGPGGRG